MEITIQKKYKSINPPCLFEFPELVVLTGKNGCGKTHLLEAIFDTSNTKVIRNGKQISNIRYIPFNGLLPNIVELCNPSQIIAFVKAVWTNFDNIVKRYYNDYASNSVTNNESINNHYYQQILSNTSDPIHRKFLEKVLKISNKSFETITEDDFSDNFEASDMGKQDFLVGQFALIFKNYHRKQIENEFNEYYKNKGIDKNKKILSQEEFIEINGIPPWDFVNEIFKETKIPYKVNNPLNTRAETTFEFKLLDKDGNFEISSKDLSTGEKVLLALALTIYNSTGGEGKPELLLLDEPDAPLHPSMSKMLINVVKKHIVSKNGIPVILTTHSPTTVVSAEGISIYQLVRGTSIPTKISSQHAVEILSSDIPFLKISTEKRRQVFVESKYDVTYYELLTNILSKLEPLQSEPIFLPARTSNGSNCTDVIDLVTNLSNNGNDQVYGLIDWDNSNTSVNRVLVLGENDRYSIENYLLDPLLMGLLFIRERKFEFTYFGIESINKYSELDKLSSTDAQLIINKILNDLGLFSENTIQTESFNGWKLKISNEFILHQGHNLEALYKIKYPFLKVYNRENSMKIDIIEKVINDYPTLTPINLFDIIRKIT